MKIKYYTTLLLVGILIILFIHVLQFLDFVESYQSTHPPFGEVSEIYILSTEKRMFEYYKQRCKLHFGEQYIHRYMNCTELKMAMYLEERDNDSTD